MNRKMGGIRGEARKDPETLRREIDATRANVDQTLDQLQSRFSPRGLRQQFVDKVKGYGARKADVVVQTVRQHPLPVVLGGIGATSLMAWNRAARNRYGYRQQPVTVQRREGNPFLLVALALAVSVVAGMIMRSHSDRPSV